MPQKNVLKTYSKGSCYHIYNRGVEKRTIFKDKQDYAVFLGYLKEYLSPPQDKEKLIKQFTLKGESFKGLPRQPKNYSNEIDLLAYCLMPNHFHLLIKQNSDRAIENFMRSLLTRYSVYFNKRYDRVGSLFQGPYKAVLVNEESYLLHLSRYIHLNPSEYSKNLVDNYSSYSEYLGKRNTTWIKTEMILSFFSQSTNDFNHDYLTYQNFVEDKIVNSRDLLGKLCLD